MLTTRAPNRLRSFAASQVNAALSAARNGEAPSASFLPPVMAASSPAPPFSADSASRSAMSSALPTRTRSANAEADRAGPTSAGRVEAAAQPRPCRRRGPGEPSPPPRSVTRWDAAGAPRVSPTAHLRRTRDGCADGSDPDTAAKGHSAQFQPQRSPQRPTDAGPAAPGDPDAVGERWCGAPDAVHACPFSRVGRVAPRRPPAPGLPRGQ